jgi:hypothetical protein
MNDFASIGLTLAALSLAFAACSAETNSGGAGAGGELPTATSSTTSSSSTSSHATTGSAQGGAGGAGAGGGGSGGAVGGYGPCTEITPTTSAWRRVEAASYGATFETSTTPNIDGAPAEDLVLTFSTSVNGTDFNGEAIGTFDLGADGNTNYVTCSQCLYLRPDGHINPNGYYQSSGTLVVHADSDIEGGAVHATLTDATLVETFFGPNFITEPIPGGKCLHIASAEIERAVVAPPPEWTCTPLFYGDGVCECGCGAVDLDCADATIASCVHCQTTDGCGTGQCPANIDPNDNAHCD